MTTTGKAKEEKELSKASNTKYKPLQEAWFEKKERWDEKKREKNNKKARQEAKKMLRKGQIKKITKYFTTTK